MSESKRVVCLGDSITEGLGDERGLGWVGRLALHLAETYPSKWDINNLGVAGDTSIDIKLRLMTECLPRYPVRLILSAGINDTTSRVWPTETGSKVDITYARDIWRQIFGAVKTNNIKKRIVPYSSLISRIEKRGCNKMSFFAHFVAAFLLSHN